MADQQGEAPKIFVDSDWKAQAQREREKLAEKDRQAKEAAEKAKRPSAAVSGPGGSFPAGAPGANPGPGSAGGAAGGGGPQQMPPADFQSLVGTMVTQALMYMGAFPDPETGRAIVSLEHARFHIDLLAILEEKTKNNLTKEEASDLAQANNELRLRFVDIVQAIAQMKKEGKLKPGAGGELGMMGGGGGAFAGPGLA
jgi:hypothetical protein